MSDREPATAGARRAARYAVLAAPRFYHRPPRRRRRRCVAGPRSGAQPLLPGPRYGGTEAPAIGSVLRTAAEANRRAASIGMTGPVAAAQHTVTTTSWPQRILLRTGNVVACAVPVRNPVLPKNPIRAFRAEGTQGFALRRGRGRDATRQAVSRTTCARRRY